MGVQEKLWTKDFVRLSLVSLFMYLVFYSLMVVVTIYALQHMQASKAAAGLAAGDFLLAALVARLIAGHSMERIGKRRMMLGGLLFYAFLQGSYFGAGSIGSFAVIRFFHGLAFGFCATAVSTLAACLVPKARRGEGMGYFLLSTTLASAIGPFIGFFVYRQYGFGSLLLVNLGLSVAAVLLARGIQLPAPDVVQVQPAAAAAHGIHSYFECKALPIAGISFLIYFCYSSLLSFFSAYAAELHMLEAGQYFFLVYSLAIIVSRPQVGKFADRRGIHSVMYPSFVLFALGLGLLSQMHTAGMMAGAAICCGVGFGTFAAMGQVLAIQKVPQERFGIALSTVLSISEFGTGVGPFVLGGLLEVCGFRWLYLLAAGMVILCGGAYYFCRKRAYI